MASVERTAHDRIHPLAGARMLDSVHVLLQPSRSGEGTRGTLINIKALMAVVSDGPLTKADSLRYRSLDARVQTEDRRIRKMAERLAKQFMTEQRRKFAENLEREYLDKGMDVTVRTRGADATTLELKWILVSRVLAHQFTQNTELWGNLSKAGFKKLVITDGYDDTWSWTIP